MRDPYQVFTLLETIFQSFDGIAKRHGVFKVETVGDCYVGTFLYRSRPARPTMLSTQFRIVRSFVASCGAPKANDRHAVIMCRFARSAMAKFRKVCRILELTLGPDTGGKCDKCDVNEEARPATLILYPMLQTLRCALACTVARSLLESCAVIVLASNYSETR
jgi:class 3 adenylate cyclase